MRLVDPDPTPVISGQSPVTAGDVSFVVDRLRALPMGVVQSLAGGSLRDPMCRVCLMLNGARHAEEITQAARDELIDWHGNDALRCGVIYGAAAALVAALGDQDPA